MRRLFIIILGIILFSGCVGLRTQQEVEEPEGNFVELARLGVNTVDMHNELIVKALEKDFPAERAGVKRGDIFISVDGKIITTKKAFYSLMDNKQRGDHVLLVINRNGQQIKFDIETRMIKVRPTAIKINKLLDENKKVHFPRNSGHTERLGYNTTLKP
jgi:C-terminal processing protease CtpA/Prc